MLRARSSRKLAGLVSSVLVVAAGLIAVAGVGPATAADATASCPLAALKKAKKPVEITMWHSMPRANEETLQGAHRQVQLVAVGR